MREWRKKRLKKAARKGEVAKRGHGKIHLSRFEQERELYTHKEIRITSSGPRGGVC